MSEDYYKEGQEAYKAWMTSPQYSAFERNASAETVIKLFLPPVPQDMIQVSRPLPPIYQEWLKGFNDAKAEDSTT